MNADAIARQSVAQVNVEVVAHTGSTNADLLARVASLTRSTLLIAESQSAGRGRAGRSWLSAAGASLTFSLAWKCQSSLQAQAGLPLAVGVALAEALAALDVSVQLKWPNDLLKDGAKLGGVLIETQSTPDGTLWAVIGIGINLDLPDELEQRIGSAAASAPWLAKMDRDTLMAKLLDHLAGTLEHFNTAGFAPFCARWNRLHAFAGCPVSIIDGGRELHQGIAAGVDERGCLLLDTESARVLVLAGDVSLRARPASGSTSGST
jgi:BirA family biotin operon repressor/biotin-[acetyl-CoA-carboxylase] ligase